MNESCNMSIDIYKGDRDETWRTPPYVFEWAEEYFGKFDLDAAASKENTKCKNFLSIEKCALENEWIGKRVWCNPPYGRKWSSFIKRGIYQLALRNCEEIIFLIPVRTDTRIFQEEIKNFADEIIFIKGRIPFIDGNETRPAPFPSCFVRISYEEDKPQIIRFEEIRKWR